MGLGMAQEPLQLAYHVLRFSLCENDNYKVEIQENYIQSFGLLVDSINNLLNTDISNQTRRKTGLLKSSIFTGIASFKYEGCEIYVNPTTFKMLNSFDELEKLVGWINAQFMINYQLPEGFNDWLDDDFRFEDDDLDFDYVELED
mmetsp:Transcript_19883/g.18054  ORF Transcript_19883/g.18054 Transcript_19883/m.18054 type:complete len:145 (+) Transcript_19883:16-450(+)